MPDAQTEPDAPDAGSDCAEPTGPGTTHEGQITADETWTAADSPHVLTGDVDIREVTVTIAPCAVVRIRKGYTIHVGEAGVPAGLVAHGESTHPIVFERDDQDAPWGSVLAGPSGMVDLEHVRLVGGGDPETAAYNGGTIIAYGEGGNTGLARPVRLVDVRIEDSAGYGLNANARGGFTADSRDVIVTGSGFTPSGTSIDTRYPVYVEGPAFSTIPSGTYTGNAVDQILVSNARSLLDSDLRFYDRGIPYRMETGFSMAPANSAADGGLSTLTIDAGVELLFARNETGAYSFLLGGSNGSLPENIWPVRLIAEGTAAAPIVFTSAEDSPIAGDWMGIAWYGGAASGNVMRHVHVEYAGGESGTAGFGCGPTDNSAAIIITNWRPADAFITDSTIADSAGGGIVSGWSTDAGGPNLRANNTLEGIANGCAVSRWADGDSSCPSDPPLCL